MESDLIKTVAPCWVWVIELTATQKADLDTDDYFYFSTKSFKLYNASNTTYYQAHGNLINIPSIQQNVDLYRFTSTKGGFTLQLDNNCKIANPENSNEIETFTDLLADYHIQNREIKIYLNYQTGDTVQTNIADMLLMYTGLTRKLSCDKGIVTLNIESPDLLENIYYPNLFDGEIEIPLVYGERRFELNSLVANTVDLDTDNYAKMAPCRFIEIDDDGYYTYHISGREMNQAATTDVWIRNRETGVMLNIDSGNISIVNNSNGCTLTIEDSSDKFTAYWYFHPTAVSSSGGNTEFTDHDNMIDKNIDSYGEADTGGAAWTTYKQAFTLPYFPGISYDSVSNLTICTRSSYVLNSGIGGGVTFQVSDGTNTEDIDTYSNTVIHTATWAWGGSIPTWYVTLNDGDNDDPDVTARVYEVFGKVHFSIDFTEIENYDVFISCKGVEADSTLATDFTSLSSGDLLENPAHVLADIIYQLGFSDIDTTSFEALETALSGWLFAPVMYDNALVNNVLQQLCQDARSWLYINAAGLFAIDTIDLQDTTQRIITKKEIKNLQLYKSDPAKLYANIQYKYFYDEHKSEFTQVNETENDGSIADTVKINSTVTVYKHENKSAVDTDTIEANSDFFIDNQVTYPTNFLAKQWNMIDVELIDLIGINIYDTSGDYQPLICLEIGDVIEISNDYDDIQKMFGESWAGEHFKIINFKMVNNSLSFTAIHIEDWL